ncbi:MAG: sugar transferase [Roseibium sp.]
MANETFSDDPFGLKKAKRFSAFSSTARFFRTGEKSTERASQTGRAQRIRAARALRKTETRALGPVRPSYKAGFLEIVFKRSLDICGAGVGLVSLSPLLFGIAIAIKLNDGGPVFFRQTRLGLNGKPFSILKFRTMYVETCDASGVQQTVSNDPRVTPIGRFLRRSSFDELPQLINVLKGEMSLVGPRPYVPGMRAAGVPYEVFDYRYFDRLKVLPGITGLAQMNGYRGETEDEKSARIRLEYDLAYIDRQSLWLDIKIVFGTVIREFVTGNGY